MMYRISLNYKDQLTLEKTVILHEGDVTACVECDFPKPCIITCGLDKRIVMYSLINGQIIRKLPKQHKSSVRYLLVYKDYGNLLLSSGYEKDVMVWSIENIVTDPLYGRLVGHLEPVTGMVQLPKQPFCVTIDTKTNIKLWNVKTLSCLQTLITEGY